MPSAPSLTTRSLQPKCRRIYLTRHGVRATQIPAWAEPEPFYEGADSYDAPIAGMGQRQAEALAEVLRDKPLDHIFSSPFRRAIMTALPIARLKGLPVKLEWGIGERLEKTWFSGFPPLPGPSERRREFPEIDPHYTSFIVPAYPEPAEQMIERVDKALANLIQNFGPNILLVGHGASTAGVRVNLLSDHPNYSKLGATFCSCHEFNYHKDRWEEADTDPYAHLEAKNLLATHDCTAST